MSAQLRLATAAVISVIAIGGGWWLLGGPQSNVASPDPTATATPRLAPSASPPDPTPSPTIDANLNYADLKGWIVYHDQGKVPVSGGVLWQIWLVKADGTGRHELAPGDAAGSKGGFDISPDGRSIVFGGAGGIWDVPIEGDRPTHVATGCSGVDGDCTEWAPSYSPDGGRIAFVREQGRSNFVCVLDLATGSLVILEATRVPFENPGGGFTYDTSPTWSADGNQIAYEADTKWTPVPPGPASESTIRIVNVDGSGLREIPAPAGQFVNHPDWSPDGSLIVFASSPNYFGGPYDITTVRPDGSGMALVCPTCLGGGFAPSWTPDGKHILFWSSPSWALVAPDGTGRGYINQAALTFLSPYRTDDLSTGLAALLQPTP